MIANHVIDLHPDCWGRYCGELMDDPPRYACPKPASCWYATMRGSHASVAIWNWEHLPWYKRLFWWVVSL